LHRLGAWKLFDAKRLFIAPVLLVMMLSGCGQNSNTATNKPDFSNADPVNTTKQVDATTFLATIQPYVDQYQGIVKQYQTIMAKESKNEYSSSAIISQMGNIGIELEHIQLGLAATTIPDDMQVYSQQFMQAVADLSSSEQDMEQAAVDSVSGSSSPDVQHANDLYKQSLSDMIQFITSEKTLASQ